MNILLIEPYFTGSHAAWAKEYQKYSSHEVEILSLSGNYWKWRMHGGAVTLARKFLEGNYTPDAILTTDMLDLTTFQSLTRTKTAQLPFYVYFHENQLAYPWSPTDRDVLKERDDHYSFINYSSALAADKVFFNSQFHHRIFFEELNKFLKGFPDNNELGSMEEIKAKSKVLPLGMDLSRFDSMKPQSSESKVPLVLWNHRWEYDKNPKDFFEALYILADKGLAFEVAVLGENFSKQPEEFDAAKVRLGEKVVHFGYAETFEDYAAWLWKADIIPVTSNQDFFGSSLLQAMYSDCYPIVPNRLAFPEHFPEAIREEYLYNDFEGLLAKLEYAINNTQEIKEKRVRSVAEKYKWELLAPVYDRELSITP